MKNTKSIIETLRATMQHSADQVLLLDADQKIEFTNWVRPPLTVEEVVGRTVYSLALAAEHAEMRGCFEGVIATQKPGSYCVSQGAGHEAVTWQAQVAPLIEDSQVVGFSVVLRDITELSRRKLELDRFFELSNDLLCISTTEGYFQRISKSFASALGYEEAELYGKPFSELIHPDDRAKTTEILQALGSGESVVDFVNRYRTKDGNYRLLAWEGGQEVGGNRVFSIARDITQQRLLEKQVRESQKLDAVGQLAGGIAHEFNNLLLAVIANAELAMSSLANESSEAYSHLQEIEQAGQRAAALTRQLLAFGSRTPLRLEPIELNALCRDLLKLVTRLIPEHIEVDFIPGYRLPKIQGDAGQIEQILMNLCINASDAMPEGGRLTIETEETLVNGRYRESHPWAKSGRYAMLTVTDTGCGMTRDVQAHIFEPFFTTKEPGTGTGLGLATVYAIVKQHGGMTHVYSEPGEGTSVKVYLPLSARLADDIDAKKDPGLPEGRETILVAEDEELVRNVVVRILERAGYRVLIAQNGHEALRLIEVHAGDVHLVLLDVVMPELSGPEVFARLEEILPGLPVLFCSGYSNNTHAASRIPEGHRLIAKPYRAEELLKRVREALAKA